MGSLSGLTCLHFDQTQEVLQSNIRKLIPQIDPGTCERRTTDVVSILLLLVVQGFEVRFDCERDYCGWIICKILLESRLIHCVFDHIGGVWIVTLIVRSNESI